MKALLRGITGILCLGILVLGFWGCGPQPSADKGSGEAFAVLTDDMGRTVKLPKKPERVVVLSASFLEPFHAVGGQVVGRPDSRTKMPEFAKTAASVGQVYQIDMEKVMSLQPDLVIINKGMNEKLLSTLEANGVPAVVVDMKSYEDVKREIGLFSAITGEKAKCEALIADMDQQIAAVKEKLPADRKRIAILHSTAQGLSVQLEGSIAGSVARGFGWENVASGMTPLEKNPDAAPYSMETLVEQNPDILFITSMGKLSEIKQNMEKTMAENPAWQSLPAVRNHQVYYLPQELFLLSPGIHYPEAVKTMAQLIYPEKFQE